MHSIQELPELKAKILERVALSAKDADVGAITCWSKAAEQCEKFIQESEELNDRIKSFTDSLWQKQGSNSITKQPIASKPKIRMSPKLAASRTRREWVIKLSSTGISLNGHNKRYYTKGRQAVGIAFANELDRPQLIDKWFLGLKDEPTDLAVLLCQDLEGKLLDFILPVAEIKTTWKALSRSKDGQVKFHIRRDPEGFVLLNPIGEPLNITKYIGKYQALK